MKFRNPYNYDTDVESFKSGLDCSNDPSRAQQHMRDETDINILVKTYARTGTIPGADIPATHFEFDEIFDYQEAMNRVIEANRMFGALPSQLRARFQNDPAQLLSFVHDDRNREEAMRLGLVSASPAAEPANTPVPAEPAPVKSE